MWHCRLARTRMSHTLSNANSKLENKPNSIRKKLLAFEKEETKALPSNKNNFLPAMKINLVTPTLRSQQHNPVITIASSTQHIPRKFFPSNSKTNKPKIEIRESAFEKFGLRRMSISSKKLARAATAISRSIIVVRQSSKNHLFTKPKKLEIARKNLEKLKKIALSAKEDLKNCLKDQQLFTIKELPSSGQMTSRTTERCMTQSSSPEVGTKRKKRTTFPACDNDLKEGPRKPKEGNERRHRRHTTQCQSSKMEGKYTLNTYAAIAKLSLEPIDYEALRIDK